MKQTPDMDRNPRQPPGPSRPAAATDAGTRLQKVVRSAFQGRRVPLAVDLSIDAAFFVVAGCTIAFMVWRQEPWM